MQLALLPGSIKQFLHSFAVSLWNAETSRHFITFPCLRENCPPCSIEATQRCSQIQNCAQYACFIVFVTNVSKGGFSHFEDPIVCLQGHPFWVSGCQPNGTLTGGKRGVNFCVIESLDKITYLMDVSQHVEHKFSTDLGRDICCKHSNISESCHGDGIHELD